MRLGGGAKGLKAGGDARPTGPCPPPNPHTFFVFGGAGLRACPPLAAVTRLLFHLMQIQALVLSQIQAVEFLILRQHQGELMDGVNLDREIFQ